MAHATTAESPFYGMLAEFDSAQTLLEAANQVRIAGYTRADAFSPFPIHGLAEALGFRERWVSKIVLAAGITGLLAGWGLEYWTQVIAWPMNIGGRPFHSWPHYIPVTFECTVLGASLAAFVGMLALNGLPRPYHPVFNVPAFDRASRDRFFLCIESVDPKFDRHATESFLKDLRPVGVSEVAA